MEYQKLGILQAILQTRIHDGPEGERQWVLSLFAKEMKVMSPHVVSFKKEKKSDPELPPSDLSSLFGCPGGSEQVAH